MRKSAGKQSEAITEAYFTFLQQHVDDVISGHAPRFLELNEIARALFVSHAHLTATIQQTTGHHPCHFYDMRIIDAAKKMLSETGKPVAEIANILTYDPSNFTKFFKKITGQTPGRFRTSAKRNA